MSWLDAPPPAAAVGNPHGTTDAARYRRALESIAALLAHEPPRDDNAVEDLLIALNTIARNALRS